MAGTARCPYCDRLVGIPEGFAEAVRVRCPLCETVFPPSEAHPAEEDLCELFPEVVPVEADSPEADGNDPAEDASEPVPAGSISEEYALASSEATADDFEGLVARQSEDSVAVDAVAPGEDMGLVVRCPHCQAESKLGELIVAATDQPLDAARLAEALGVGSVTAGEGIDLSTNPWQGIETAASSSAFDFGQSAPNGAGRASDDLARRRKSSGSFVGQLVGIILGGLLALPIAYYALNLIRGEQFDWFSVPLPFAPHTYKHLPEWWPQWARPSSGEIQEPAAPAIKQQPARPDGKNPKAGKRQGFGRARGQTRVAYRSPIRAPS